MQGETQKQKVTSTRASEFWWTQSESLELLRLIEKNSPFTEANGWEQVAREFNSTGRTRFVITPEMAKRKWTRLKSYASRPPKGGEKDGRYQNGPYAEKIRKILHIEKVPMYKKRQTLESLEKEIDSMFSLSRRNYHILNSSKMRCHSSESEIRARSQQTNVETKRDGKMIVGAPRTPENEDDEENQEVRQLLSLKEKANEWHESGGEEKERIERTLEKFLDNSEVYLKNCVMLQHFLEQQLAREVV